MGQVMYLTPYTEGADIHSLIRVKEADVAPTLVVIEAFVGGMLTHTRGTFRGRPVSMYCDDNGCSRGLPPNVWATWMYHGGRVPEGGWVILGPVVALQGFPGI